MASLTADHKDYMCHNGEESHSYYKEIPDPPSVHHNALCDCDVEPGTQSSIKHTGKSETNSYEWSRLGPMGKLLEPKLYPISICSTPAAPKNDSICTRELQRTITDKCDLPLNEKFTSPLPLPDILRRINEDRLRSTYQTDFGHMDDYPWADYDDPIIPIDYKSRQQLEPPREEKKCRERPRPPYLNGHEIPGRPTKDSSMFAFGTRRSKTKRGGGSQVTNRPLRPVKPKRVSLQSSNVYEDDDDDLGTSKAALDHRRSLRRSIGKVTDGEERQRSRISTGEETSRIFSGPTGDKRTHETEHTTAHGRKQTSEKVADENENGVGAENIRNYRMKVTEDAISENRMKEFSYTAADNNRETSGDMTSIVRGSIDNRHTSDVRQDSIDMTSLNARENSHMNRKDDKERGRFQRESKISRKHMTNLGKVKENNDEFELLPSMPGTSEYQDIISRTADDILRTKLHYYGKIRLVTPHPDCL